jgi:hypothetical protein
VCVRHINGIKAIKPTIAASPRCSPGPYKRRAPPPATTAPLPFALKHDEKLPTTIFHHRRAAARALVSTPPALPRIPRPLRPTPANTGDPECSCTSRQRSAGMPRVHAICGPPWTQLRRWSTAPWTRFTRFIVEE